MRTSWFNKERKPLSLLVAKFLFLYLLGVRGSVGTWIFLSTLYPPSSSKPRQNRADNDPAFPYSQARCESQRIQMESELAVQLEQRVTERLAQAQESSLRQAACLREHHRYVGLTDCCVSPAAARGVGARPRPPTVFQRTGCCQSLGGRAAFRFTGRARRAWGFSIFTP